MPGPSVRLNAERLRDAFDPRSGRFVDCDEADALLTKTYRSPYVLPEVG